jgi:hypothetical protein
MTLHAAGARSAVREVAHGFRFRQVRTVSEQLEDDKPDAPVGTVGGQANCASVAGTGKPLSSLGRDPGEHSKGVMGKVSPDGISVMIHIIRRFW